MDYHVKTQHSDFSRLREGDAETKKFQTSYTISDDERNAVKQRLASDSTRKPRRGGADPSDKWKGGSRGEWKSRRLPS